MLDISLDRVSFAYGSGFALSDLTFIFPKGAHTAVVGLPGCGSSTLLRLIAGEIRPDSGEIRIGARVVNSLRTSRRPLLYATSELDVPQRWSVKHALINAVRARTIDREDRYQELALAASKWQLEQLVERKIGTLSESERLRVHLARIELFRPGIVVADRLLERTSPSLRSRLADDFYRTLRVLGATVVSAVSSHIELGMTDRIVVLEDGRIAQSGSPAQLFASPASEAAAVALGDINIVPVRIEGNTVVSVIGEWTVENPPFSGNGIALARPDAFFVAAPGEESDLIFGIEEAWYDGGRWMAKGLLTGGGQLRVVLPRETAIRKGKLLALRYDPAAFTLLPRADSVQSAGVPTDVIPPMSETR